MLKEGLLILATIAFVSLSMWHISATPPAAPVDAGVPDVGAADAGPPECLRAFDTKDGCETRWVPCDEVDQGT